jgi:hypothetical protein
MGQSDDFVISDKLAPYEALAKNKPDEVRWITRVMYTQIQCIVMQRKLQAQVDRARSKGIPSPKAEERLKQLMAAESIDEQEYWLQDQAGRAMLSCTVCGTHDVVAVMEMKQKGHRVRVCHSCMTKKGWLLDAPNPRAPIPNLHCLPVGSEED